MQEDREKVKTLQNEIKDVKEKLSKAGPSTEEVRTFLLVQFWDTRVIVSTLLLRKSMISFTQ